MAAAAALMTAAPAAADGVSRAKIVGGQAAAAGAWPWQVAVMGEILCGGTTVGDGWILTAAHCVLDDAGKPLAASEFEVVAGSLTVGDGGERLAIERIVPFPGYDTGSQDGDIALLKLKGKARLPAVALASPAVEGRLAPPGTMAVITGWGTTAPDGAAASSLMQAEVPLVDAGACRRVYPGLTDNMLCAGHAQGGIDACQGDSGGPILVGDGRGGHVQIGIVSFGKGCAEAGAPGVYTRVSRFADWIDSTIGGGGAMASSGAGPAKPASMFDGGGRPTAGGGEYVPLFGGKR